MAYLRRHEGMPAASCVRVAVLIQTGRTTSGRAQWLAVLFRTCSGSWTIPVGITQPQCAADSATYMVVSGAPRGAAMAVADRLHGGCLSNGLWTLFHGFASVVSSFIWSIVG